MSLLKSSLILTFVIMLPSIARAGYETVTTFQSPNNLVTVKFVADKHNAPKDIHEKQRLEQQALFAELGKTKKDSVHVIAEDMTDCPQESQNVKEYSNSMRQNPTNSALVQVMQLCKQHNLSATNTEYRFKRSAGLAYFCKNNMNCRNLAEEITTDELLEEYNNAAVEIQSYSDTAKLGCYYTNLTSNTDATLQPLQLTLTTHHDSIASYIETEIPSQKRYSFARELLLFDFALLDARIIHAIYEQMTKSALDMQPRTVLTFAGKYHAYATGKKLEELLNFTKERSIGTETQIIYPSINFNAYFVPQIARPVINQQPTSILNQISYLDGKTLSECLLD